MKKLTPSLLIAAIALFGVFALTPDVRSAPQTDTCCDTACAEHGKTCCSEKECTTDCCKTGDAGKGDCCPGEKGCCSDEKCSSGKKKSGGGIVAFLIGLFK